MNEAVNAGQTATANLTDEFIPDSFWDRFGKWSLYFLAFLIPIWILPFTANSLATNKVALSYFLIILALIFWLIGRINTGVVVLPRNYMAVALVLLVAVWFLSGVFSTSPHISFFELSDDVSGFFAVLMFAAAAFVAYFYLRTPKDIFFWFSFMFFSAFLVFILQFLRVAFGLNIFAWVDFPSPVSNVFGSWSEFAILFSVVGVISLFLFEILAERRLRAVFFTLSAVSFIALVLANSSVAWWVTLVFLLVVLAYLLSLRPQKINIFRVTFFALLTVLLFIQAPAISSPAVSYFGLDSVEVRPSWPASWTVIQKSVEENPLLGSGPATFVYDWMRFKPLAVNESIFWATRFSNAIAFVPSLLASSGIAGFVAFMFLALSFVYYGARALVNSGQTRLDPIFVLVLLASFMIFSYLFVYTAGFTLTLFLFLFLGMFMAMISEYKFAREYRLNLFQSSGSGFISALAIIFLLIVAFSGLYILGQRYVSAYFFGRALRLSSAGDFSASRAALGTAVSFDKRDVYFRSAVELDLQQISELLGRNDISAEDVRGGFQNILSGAIQNAQNAVNLNPADSLNWSSLGRVYEAVIPFQIQGAANFASAAYIEASNKNPSSPDLLLAQARVALASNDLVKAKELLEKSLTLKSNYTPAHFLLAQIEDAQGNLAAAIGRAEAAAILSPNDIGALFQLGLLYYRSDRFNNAGAIFERAVALNPNYSNARYFLGLIYDRLGDKSSAIEQFERVKSLNPQNQEVEKILSNLLAGKKALSGITPPPEERKELPVKE